MADRTEISQIIYSSMAEIFNRDASFFEEHPETRLREDLTAKSMEYFPLIADLEDKLGIQIEYHDFQTETRTVGATVDYVCALAEAQGK